MSVRFRLRDAVGMLHAPSSQDSKYTRGIVGLMTGSDRYPGAGVLSASAALRAGAGYVRYVGPENVQQLLLTRHPEAVMGEGRADCWVIGSGLQSLGTDKRADEIRVLLDPLAPSAADSDAADLLERLEPSDAVGADAAPAIRVVDAGALVDFGGYAVAAQEHEHSEMRSSASARTSVAQASTAHAFTRDSSGRTSQMNQANQTNQANQARDVPSGAVQTASSISMSSAVRREGMSPFSASSRSRVTRASSSSQSSQTSALSTTSSGSSAVSAAATPSRRLSARNPLINQESAGAGRPLDPAAFWKKPADQSASASASASASTSTEQSTPSTSSAPSAQNPRSGYGTRTPHDAAIVTTNTARRSQLQRELDDARREHSNPLPGVLARNMVGISRATGGERATREDRSVSRVTGSTAYQRTFSRPGESASRMNPAIHTIGSRGMMGEPAHRLHGTGSKKLYVITPHSGELARLMSSLNTHAITREAVESDRRGWAQKAADQLGCVVVLKGAHTFVAAPHSTLIEVVAPTYWLSTAGTGDVLAGTLGTVLAQLRGDIASGRVSLQRAVALGVYIHGYAGGIASGVLAAHPSHPLTAEPLGMSGQSDLVGRPLLAMDVVAALPYAIHALLDAARSLGPSGLPPRR